jgi:hypothetical protein
MENRLSELAVGSGIAEYEYFHGKKHPGTGNSAAITDRLSGAVFPEPSFWVPGLSLAMRFTESAYRDELDNCDGIQVIPDVVHFRLRDSKNHTHGR